MSDEPNASAAQESAQPILPIAMYTRIVVEIVFATEDAPRCEAQLDDLLVEGLGTNYVAHQRRTVEMMTEERCEQVLESLA